MSRFKKNELKISRCRIIAFICVCFCMCFCSSLSGTSMTFVRPKKIHFVDAEWIDHDRSHVVDGIPSSPFSLCIRAHIFRLLIFRAEKSRAEWWRASVRAISNSSNNMHCAYDLRNGLLRCSIDIVSCWDIVGASRIRRNQFILRIKISTSENSKIYRVQHNKYINNNNKNCAYIYLIHWTFVITASKEFWIRPLQQIRHVMQQKLIGYSCVFSLFFHLICS